MKQARTANIERDASPKYTESKRTAVKNSVTRRNSRKSERDEGSGGKAESKKGRVTRDGIYERPLMDTLKSPPKLVCHEFSKTPNGHERGTTAE